MKIKIKTKVSQPIKKVFAQFDIKLFQKLAPPFPPVKVQTFEGCNKGNIVALKLNFIFFQQEWVSLITDFAETDTEIYFIDEGIKLPFFLQYWRHKHLITTEGIENKAEIAYIIDDIEFKTPLRVLDFLMYPLLYLQFWYRKPIYQRFFRKGKN